MKQNYPNPFIPATTIIYELPKAEIVKIEIFNVLGQKMETLIDQQMPAGSHKVELSAGNFSSGVYLYRIEAGEFQVIRKMMVMK